jgi:hypothetical protein
MLTDAELTSIAFGIEFVWIQVLGDWARLRVFWLAG